MSGEIVFEEMGFVPLKIQRSDLITTYYEVVELDSPQASTRTRLEPAEVEKRRCDPSRDWDRNRGLSRS